MDSVMVSHHPGGDARTDAPTEEGAATQPQTLSGRGPSDAALVIEARAGERWAQEALFRRYEPMASRQAFRLAPWADEAEDIVQDAFIEVLRSLHRFDAARPFGPWLRCIVVRVAMQRIRKHRLRQRFGLARRHEPLETEALTSPTASPEDAASLREVYGLLDALPAEERVALILRRVERLTIKEVAARMGLSEPTVKRRIKRAQRRLDAALGEGGRHV